MGIFHNLEGIIVWDIKNENGVTMILPEKAPKLRLIWLDELNLAKSFNAFNLEDCSSLTELKLWNLNFFML